MRLAVVGLGKVGRSCLDAASLCPDLVVAAVVRRASSGEGGLPEPYRQIPVVTHIGRARDIEAAMICVPTTAAGDAAAEVLQQGIPIVDCVTLHGEAFQRHKAVMHKLAMRSKLPAIVGAGWDPGALSVLRSWLALLTPGGATQMSHRPGVSLHHTAMARTVKGVKDALCAEVRTAEGKLRRYVYVELEQGPKADQVTEAICADPLFLSEETQVFVVENLAAFEQEGRGVVLDRRGASDSLGHQHFVLEARADEVVLTARVMLAATRVLPELHPGAYDLAEVSLSALWGEQAAKAAQDWL
jgi:diaminopimelate dehydrogenase